MCRVSETHANTRDALRRPPRGEQPGRGSVRRPFIVKSATVFAAMLPHEELTAKRASVGVAQRVYRRAQAGIGSIAVSHVGSAGLRASSVSGGAPFARAPDQS
jgi:hypothetical protein